MSVSLPINQRIFSILFFRRPVVLPVQSTLLWQIYQDLFHQLEKNIQMSTHPLRYHVELKLSGLFLFGLVHVTGSCYRFMLHKYTNYHLIRTTFIIRTKYWTFHNLRTISTWFGKIKGPKNRNCFLYLLGILIHCILHAILLILKQLNLIFHIQGYLGS